MVCCVRLHLMLSAKALGMLVKSAHKNWKKAKDKFCADKFDVFIKLCKNEGNVDVRNMLYDSRKKIIVQNKTRLKHVIKFVEFCGRQERLSKKQDGRLVGRTTSFRGEYSQFFIYKLRAFLDYSNHKQFFLFKVFAYIIQPPLRKILALPLGDTVTYLRPLHQRGPNTGPWTEFLWPASQGYLETPF